MVALAFTRNGSGHNPYSGSAQSIYVVQPCVSPSSDPLRSTSISYSEAVKYQISSCSPPFSTCLVQEAPTISLLMGQEAEDEEVYFRENSLICRFIGLWPWLMDLNGWISSHWNPLIKEYFFIHPCLKGFFIAEFDLAADRDLILDSCPCF
jgi:hypothetical protein